MQQIDLEIIRKRIDVLKKTNSIKIGRSAATCWINFNIDGDTYALHLQTAFRIRSNKDILIANLDMFEPTETLEKSPSFDWETFNWDVQGFNRFDEWTRRFNRDIGNKLSVNEVFINSFGDITIKFNSNIVLEVFLNASTEEYVRFFKVGGDDHLVVTAQGTE